MVLSGSRQLPLLVEPNGALDPALIERALQRHGAILFRGFPVQSPADFEDFAGSMSGELQAYAGGISPRTAVHGRIYESTRIPRHFQLPLHNEMAYADSYPDRVFFYCHVAPERGGETPLADSRRIYRRIDPAVRERFEAKQVQYRKVYTSRTRLFERLGSRRTWQASFDTGARSEVERFCRDHGLTCEWRSNGDLVVTNVRPAVAVHPNTQERVWFNQAHVFASLPQLPGALSHLAYRAIRTVGGLGYECRFGDGSPIDPADLRHIADVMEEEAVTFPWRRGDVLLVDNLLAAHGRMPYRGDRQILIALVSQARAAARRPAPAPHPSALSVSPRPALHGVVEQANA